MRSQYITLTTPRSNWQETLANNIESAISRRQRERDAAAATAEQEGEETTAKSFRQQRDATVTNAGRRTEPANLDCNSVVTWQRTQRGLHDILPSGVRPGLREERATWQAWDSVPNVRRGSTGQRLIHAVDRNSPIPGLRLPRSRPTQETTSSRSSVSDGECSFDFCNESCSMVEEVRGPMDVTTECPVESWWLAYPWLVEILHMPDR
ncbi:hypothetical protein BKA66DRAFT_3801 [Pyrenochaeta sp. MPI-SDFR-AT-0127]|nr:hypothetical protein BKA66DRAFT_3801 [Pyrenochaeta sp. MPI-SDFR-AT-0127]